MISLGWKVSNVMQFVERQIVTDDITNQPGDWVVCGVGLDTFGASFHGFMTVNKNLVISYESALIARFANYDTAATFRDMAALNCTELLYVAYVTRTQYVITVNARIYVSHDQERFRILTGLYFVGYSRVTSWQLGDISHTTAIPVLSTLEEHAARFSNTLTVDRVAGDLLCTMHSSGLVGDVPPGSIRQTYIHEDGSVRTRSAILTYNTSRTLDPCVYLIANGPSNGDSLLRCVRSAQVAEDTSIPRLSMRSKEARVISLRPEESE